MLKNAFQLRQTYLQFLQKKAISFKQNDNNNCPISTIHFQSQSMIHKQVYSFAKVSWKKLMESYNYKNTFYEEYTVSNVNPRMQTNQCSLLIYPLNSMFQRVGEFQYFVDKGPLNYLLTFLEKFEGVDYQLLWKNRKTFGLSIRDIFLLEKYEIGKPSITISKLKESQTEAIIKNLTIGSSFIKEDDKQQPRISIRLQIFTKGPERNLKQWQHQLLVSPNDFQQFILASKKQIYSISGMKTTLDLQKSLMIKRLNKKISKEQITASPIPSNLNIQD